MRIITVFKANCDIVLLAVGNSTLNSKQKG